MSEVVKDSHLRANVIDHERILAELNLDAKLLLNKIHVTERAFNRCPVLVVFEVILRRVVAINFQILPPFRIELSLEGHIERDGTVESLPRHRLFFTNLRSRLGGIYQTDRVQDFGE